MQREIKFRAWLKEYNRMENCVGINPFNVNDCDRLYWKHDEVILMQYTGLKDKNDKEIYEGDIVTVYREKRDSIDIAIVEWLERYAMYSMVPLHNWEYTQWSEVNIIGNIHEHRELLAK